MNYNEAFEEGRKFERLLLEKEAVERERKAFYDGAMCSQVWSDDLSGDKANYEAVRRYPLPKEEL